MPNAVTMRPLKVIWRIYATTAESLAPVALDWTSRTGRNPRWRSASVEARNDNHADVQSRQRPGNDVPGPVPASRRRRSGALQICDEGIPGFRNRAGATLYDEARRPASLRLQEVQRHRRCRAHASDRQRLDVLLHAHPLDVA